MLKHWLRSLRPGEKIWALVDEIQSQNQVVINFSGDLIRITNESDRKFRVGQRVLLQVETLHPLKFKIIVRAHTEHSTRGPLDISI